MGSIDILKQVIAGKRKTNPRLSLRSIAKRMGVTSGRLSEILSGKRRLTDYYLEKACEALNLNSEEEALLKKSHYHSSQEGMDGGEAYGTLLREHQIEILSDWKPYAIMSYLQTASYEALTKRCPQPMSQLVWVSRRMGISEQELSDLIKVLVDVNLIAWRENGWAPTYQQASTGYDVPNKYIQSGHAKDLDLAQNKLFSVPVSKRDFSSMTVAIHPKNLTKAKKMIREFRRQFATVLEKGEKQNVYQLQIQFFPLIEG